MIADYCTDRLVSQPRLDDDRAQAPLTVLPTARFAHRARLAEPALA
ncbi:MAG: hypothetical protein WD674_06235 [Cucumibacter sp.]